MRPLDKHGPQEAFAQRVTAFILDVVLFGLVYGALWSTGIGREPALLLALVLFFVYLVLTQGSLGYTLGKAAVGVRVVRAGGIQATSITTELKRGALFLLESGIIFFVLFGLAGLQFIGITIASIIAFITLVRTSSDKQRQRIGDKVAHTEVVGSTQETMARGISFGGLIVLYFALLAAISLPLSLALLAIFGPMAVGIGWALVGIQHNWAAWPWLVGAGYTFIPAMMMSTVDLCHRTGSTCPNSTVTNDYQLAAVAVGILVAVSLLIMLFRSPVTYVIFAVGVAFSEIWMYLRLKSDPDLDLASYILLILLAGSIYYEIRRRVKHRRNLKYAELQI